jgi:hypothetical protein
MQVVSLTDPEKAVLGIVLQKGVVSGLELLSRTNLTEKDLLLAIQALLGKELVSSDKFPSVPDDVRTAYINIRSYAIGLARDLLYRA